METFKTNLIEVLASICVILGLFLVATFFVAYKYKQESDRKDSNINAFTDSVTKVTTKLGHEVSSTKSLLLTKEELIKSQDSKLVSLNKHIKDMEIKYRKLQSAGIGFISTKDSVAIRLHDTIYKDTSGLIREIKTGIYKDLWTTITMTIKGDSAYCSYSTTDTLVYTSSIKKRGKWTFKNIIPFNGRKKELVIDAKLARKNATLVLYNVNINQ